MDGLVGSRIGPYVVESLLGEGGVASVYRARHVALGSAHALKLLHVIAPSLKRRLQLEGSIQACVRHPNIVSVTDWVEHEGLVGLVMEYVDGMDLEALMASGPLSVAWVDRLAHGLFDGVRAVHEAGYIHRDLKPANVLVARLPSGELLPKIADFGLAKHLGSGRGKTRDGALMGTPAFMSPEQVQDSSDTDERTDVWAIAAILYELCTGRPAFPGDDFQAMVAVTSAEPVCPSALRSGLPERMVAAIRAGLVKSRSQRVQSVADLASVWSGQRRVTSPRAASTAGHLSLLVRPAASAPKRVPASERGRRQGTAALVHSMRSNST